jgi:hypothetical protein
VTWQNTDSHALLQLIQAKYGPQLTSLSPPTPMGATTVHSLGNSLLRESLHCRTLTHLSR